MPHLEVLDVDGRPVGVHELTGERTLVGRDVDVDVRLQDPRVSRRHAAVLVTERGVLAVALGDNLLRREQRQCTHLFVDDGVPFRLGDTKVRLVDASAAVATTLLDEPSLHEPPPVASPLPAPPIASPPLAPEALRPDAPVDRGVLPAPAPAAEGTATCLACHGPTSPRDAYCGHCGEPLRRSVLGPLVAVIAVVLVAVGVGRGLGWW